MKEPAADHYAEPISSATKEVRSACDWVRETARDNPTLVVSSTVAIGALAALFLMNRKPHSRAVSMHWGGARQFLCMAHQPKATNWALAALVRLRGGSRRRPFHLAPFIARGDNAYS